MTCVLAGFPSNIAALQFEWAWHNAHLTRHIPPGERISFATTRVKTSPTTGKTKRRPGRPKASMIDKLSNLHLLLRVPYFSRWPLELRFFSMDVFQLWQTWCQRVDGKIPPGIKVWLDLPKEEQEPASQVDAGAARKKHKHSMIGKGGVNGIDPTYVSLQPVLEKSLLLLEEDEQLSCRLCDQGLNPKHDLITICPQTHCQSFHHMTCLSSHFLNMEGTVSLIPDKGKCPSCNAPLSWLQLMKEMTLRIRSEKEARKIMKGRRQMAPISSMEGDDQENQESEEDPLMPADVADEDDYDDGASVTTVDSKMSRDIERQVALQPTTDINLPTVIEDSDCDTIDLLSD